MFTPFAFIKSPSPIPLEGLVAWYDAEDYVSGTTWVDRSVNAYNLTIAGAGVPTKVTVGGPFVEFTNNRAYTANSITQYSATNDITYIEIVRDLFGYDDTQIASFALNGSSYGVSSYMFDGTNSVYTYSTNGKGWYLNGKSYNYLYTDFVARRIVTGFSNTSPELKVSWADSFASLVHYGAGSFTSGGGGASTYDLQSPTQFVLGATGAGGAFPMAARYGVSILYNRLLSDSEIDQIYEYYKPIYALA